MFSVFFVDYSLAVGFISATTGFQVPITSGTQVVGGLILPGNAFGNMWFTTDGASVTLQVTSMLKDLSYGQYIHLPPYLVACSQLIGCTFGSLASMVVIKAIFKNEREILLSPNCNGVFSGAEVAQFQARSVRFVFPFFIN
jgi:hypothetical protein